MKELFLASFVPLISGQPSGLPDPNTRDFLATSLQLHKRLPFTSSQVSGLGVVSSPIHCEREGGREEDEL